MQVKRGKRLYTYVLRAATALNATFSLITFIYLFSVLITTILFLYHLIAYFIEPTPLFQFLGFVIFFQLFFNIGIFVFILFTAKSHVQKVKTLTYSRDLRMIHFPMV